METWTTNASSSQSGDGNSSNISSHNQFCTGSANPFLDIPMLLIHLPITLYVIAELFLRQCVTSANPGNSSPSSQSELLFLHVTITHSMFYIGILLNIIRNLAGVTGIPQAYVTAFHSCSLIGGSIFFAGMTLDLYIAVAHPVMYVNQKASTKQIQAHIFCTLVWIYNITMGTIIVVFNITMYHPLTMASFCGTVPVSFIICVVILFTLQPSGSGKSSQTSKTDTIKKNAIRFMMNSLIILAFYFLPHISVMIYMSVEKVDWQHLSCEALPVTLMVQITEFLTPLIFFYNAGKISAIVKKCSTVFCKTGS